MNSKNILIKVNQLYKIFGDGDKSALDLVKNGMGKDCLLYTSPSPRDRQKSRMPSSA